MELFNITEDGRDWVVKGGAPEKQGAVERVGWIKANDLVVIQIYLLKTSTTSRA